MEANVLLFELALTFYLLATIAGIVEIFKKKKGTSRAVLYLAVIGFLCHTANIIVRYAEGGHIPVTNMHEASSFFA